jgi:Sporulation and spore germination
VSRIRLLALPLVLVASACGATGSVRDEGGKALADPIRPQGTAEQTVAVYLLQHGKSLKVDRRVSGAPTPERATLVALLEGPTPTEAKRRVGTAIPPGAQLVDFTLEDGAAKIDLVGPFATIQRYAATDDIEARQRQKLLEQIVYTLTEFDTVRSVEVRLNGATIPLLSNQFGPALTRDVFDQAAVKEWHDQTRCVGDETVRGKDRGLRLAVPTFAGGVVSFSGETNAKRGAIVVQLEQDGSLLRSLEEGASYNRPADGGPEPCSQFEGRVEVPWGVSGTVDVRVTVQPVDAGATEREVKKSVVIGDEADLAT